MTIHLTLPEPPSANRYWRHVGNRVLLSKEAREYRLAVQAVCLVEQVQPIHGALAVEITWFRGRKSGDLDNRFKQMLDALRQIAYADDAQIVAIHAYRKEDPSNPRAEVVIFSV